MRSGKLTLDILGFHYYNDNEYYNKKHEMR